MCRAWAFQERVDVTGLGSALPGVFLSLAVVYMITKTVLTNIGVCAANPVTTAGTTTLRTTVGTIAPTFSGGPARRTCVTIATSNSSLGVCPTGRSNGFINTTIRDGAVGKFNNRVHIVINFSARNGLLGCSILRRTRAPKLKTGVRR